MFAQVVRRTTASAKDIPVAHVATPLIALQRRYFRIGAPKPEIRHSYKVNNKVNARKAYRKGMRDEDGEFVRPPAIDPDLLREARDATIKDFYKREKYSERKRYLVDRYRRTLDKSKLIICVQPTKLEDFEPFRDSLKKYFKVLHVRNGLVHIQDRSYARLRDLLIGVTKVLYISDEAKLFEAIAHLKKTLGNHPNILFLGGAVDGAAVTGFEMLELAEYQSKAHILGNIIPMLSQHMQLIPVLQSNTLTLTRILNKREEDLQKLQDANANPN